MRDLDRLPPTLDTETAAELLGVSRGTLWASARDGDAPVEPIRVGRRLRWPTRKILDLLGVSPPSGDRTADAEVVGLHLSTDQTRAAS